MQSTSMTRDELYQRVWAMPKSRLAKELGVSDTGLAKICKRQSVPFPPRGYWARKRAGRPVTRAPLPDVGKDCSGPVNISADLQPAYDAKLPTHIPVTVAPNLGNLHPIVEAWLAARAPIRRFREQEDRRYRILDAVFRAVETHGLTPQATRTGFHFDYQSEKLVCGLDEVARKRHKLADEQLQPSAPTTILRFTIRAYLPPEYRLRRNWSDRKNQPLESMCGQIAATLVRAAAALVLRRSERDAQQWRWREARRQYRTKLQEQQAELAQLQTLLEQFELHKRMEDLRAFVAMLEERATDHSALVAGRPLSAWFRWTRERIRLTDPLEGDAVRVFEAVARASTPERPR